jgi:hypothetical protein
VEYTVPSMNAAALSTSAVEGSTSEPRSAVDTDTDTLTTGAGLALGLALVLALALADGRRTGPGDPDGDTEVAIDGGTLMLVLLPLRLLDGVADTEPEVDGESEAEGDQLEVSLALLDSL